MIKRNNILLNPIFISSLLILAINDHILTTLGQLNFFRWIFNNNIINYAIDNYDIIYKKMIYKLLKYK